MAPEPVLAAPPPAGPSAVGPGPFGLGAEATGVALALLAPLLWSTSGMFVKLLPLEALPLAGLRALIAGLVLAPFIRPGRIAWNGPLLAVLAAYTQSVFCFVAAVKLTTVANAIALVSTAPVWVMLLHWLGARRVLWLQLVPVAAILTGIAIVLAEPAAGGSARGNALALAAGVGFGVFTYFLPRVDRGSPGLIGLCNLMAAAVLFLAAPAAFRLPEIPLLDWIALAYLGSVQIALATVCFGAALRRIPALRASLLALLEPLLAPLWAFLAISEVPSIHGFLGGACILGGILADLWTRRLSIRPRAASLERPAG